MDKRKENNKNQKDSQRDKGKLEKTMDLAEGERETVEESLRQHEQKDKKKS